MKKRLLAVTCTCGWEVVMLETTKESSQSLIHSRNPCCPICNRKKEMTIRELAIDNECLLVVINKFLDTWLDLTTFEQYELCAHILKKLNSLRSNDTDEGKE